MLEGRFPVEATDVEELLGDKVAALTTELELLLKLACATLDELDSVGATYAEELRRLLRLEDDRWLLECLVGRTALDGPLCDDPPCVDDDEDMELAEELVGDATTLLDETLEVDAGTLLVELVDVDSGAL